MLCWIAYFVSYIGRLNYSACMPAIMPELGISKTFAGTISTGFLACYGAGQLLNGILGDRISPKLMIGVGLGGVGLMNISMGLSFSPYFMLVVWCLNGIFNSMLWSPIIHCFSEWLPEDRQQKCGVRLSATIPAGSIVSYLISSASLRFLGWRWAFVICGGILLCYCAVWFAGITSIKPYISLVISQRTERRAASSSPEAGGVNRPSLLPLIAATGLVFAVVGILFNGILKDGVTQWVPTYVSDFFAVSPSTATAITMILPVINLTGAYAASYLNRKFFRNEMATCVSLFAVSIAALAMLFFFGKYSMVAAVVFIAMSTASMLGVNSMLLTFIPLHFGAVGRSSSVTGFLNACSYIASALSSVTIGFIAQNCGWNLTVISWIGVALFGTLACLAGVRFWAKGLKKLESM